MYTNDQLYFPGNNGEAVLLLHGLTSGAAQMVPMARFLNDHGYTVRCANLAGHGTYPEDLLHTTAEDLIAKAEYDYAQLCMESSSVSIGGISTGGLLSLYLAAKHPEIKRIFPTSTPIWLCSGSFISQEYPVGTVWIDRPLGTKPGLFRKYHIHYEKIAVRIFDELRRLMDIIKAPGILSAVKCPTLIIQAQDDDVAEPQSADYILQHISSAAKKAYLPDSGGHLCLLSTSCYELFSYILAFLKEH